MLTIPEEGNVIWRGDRSLLLQGDAREILPLIPSESVDAIITDPPYGIGYASYDSEESAEVFFELEEEFFRVLKPHSWFVFWWSQKNLPEAFRFKNFEYCWMMITAYQRANSRCPLGWKAYQPILIFRKGSPKVLAKRQDTIPGIELPSFNIKVKQRDFKPTYVQATLLAMFGQNGVVLDPFAGFGSLLVANAATGVSRLVVGIEKDEERAREAARLLSC